MIARLLLSLPHSRLGTTLATTARQKADTWAVGQAKSMKQASSVIRLSFVLLGMPAARRVAPGLRRSLFHSGLEERGTVYAVSKW